MMRRPALLLSLGLLVTGTTSLISPNAAAQILGPELQDEPAAVAIDPTVENTPANTVEIAQAIVKLSSAKFSERESAQAILLAAGGGVIDALETAATSDDLEAATRCVEILVQIHQQEKNTAALAALERLAADPAHRIATDAARMVAELKMTDEDRAEAALTAQGVRIYRSPQGKAFSVSVTKNSQLALLKYLPELRMADLSGKEITDVGMKYLADAKQLAHVSLMRCSITDAGLSRLAALPKLTHLGLASDSVTGNGLRQLQHISTLRMLMISAPATENQLKALVEVSQIDSLALSNVDCNQATCALINQLVHLKRLNMSVEGISDEHLGWLGQIEVPLSLNVGRSPEITDEGWKLLKDGRILGLSLMHTTITDAGLAHIGSLRLLESLTIFKASISDAGLEQLRELKSLRTLSLHETDVTEAGLARLKSLLPGLRHASLGAGVARPVLPQPEQLRFTRDAKYGNHAHLMSRRLTAADVEQLKQEPDLGMLHLSFRGTTDDDLMLLAEVPLKGLRFDSEKITDRGILSLEKHPTLQTLAIRSSNMSDSALESIGRIPLLNKLTIQQSQITDSGLRDLIDQLAKKGQMKSLTIYKCPNLTDASLQSIGQLTSLEFLSLSNNASLSSAIFEQVATLSNLTQLEVNDIELDEADLVQLKQLAKLQTLGLSRSELDTRLTDRGLALISELTSLQSLSIEYADISDAGIDALVVLRGLKSLALYGTQITDRSLATIADSFPNLESLELTGTQVTDAGMVHVGKLTELEWLFLDKTRVGDEGIRQLDQLNKLEHIYLTAANISNAGHQRFASVHPQTSVRLK